MPVKPLSFKGEKKTKKRKAAVVEEVDRHNDTQLDDDDTWVTADEPSDLSGPTLLVLPTSPPACLACDAAGDVFLSNLENIIEGNLGTAEPHDVRQVWIATKVPTGVGKEGEDKGDVLVSFKGSHGRYLGCERGSLRADAVAVGLCEGFKVFRDTGFSLQGNGKGYICVKETTKGWEVRGDGDEPSTVEVRMQAKFKPRLKADKEIKAREKISRRELEAAVGRKLEDNEVKRLKRARKDGTYHEEILDVRVKGKHDKFASC